MAEEAKKIITDNGNIENQESLDKNEIKELVHRDAMNLSNCFINFSMCFMRTE